MKVFMGLRSIRHPLQHPVITLGAFDGIHRAHQRLLKRVIGRARRLQGEAVLVTFDPHPLKVLKPELPFFALTCIEDRLRLLRALGLDACVVVKFTKAFSRLSAEDFIRKVLVGKLGVRELWVGYNYVFGKGREGNIHLLRRFGKRFGFVVRVLPEVKIGGEKFSSTRIRKLIAKGKLQEASFLLGRPYTLLGKVISGRGRGKRLGYPTANLKPFHSVGLPRGVYAVKASFPPSQKAYIGLVNIGLRPTFEQRKNQVVEVHLLDFKGDLYGRKVKVLFLERIRHERKFPTKKALIRRIQLDEAKVRALELSKALQSRMDLPA